jgi:hypothetical protein
VLGENSEFLVECCAGWVNHTTAFERESRAVALAAQPIEAVNLRLDTEDTYPCRQIHVVCGHTDYGVLRICTEKERW